VEDHPLRGPLFAQDLDDVVVGVAVVDLQRQSEPFGDVDMAAERIALVGQALPLGPEEVQAGLPDRPDPRMAGERLDLGQGILQAAAPGVAGGVVGGRATAPRSRESRSTALTVNRDDSRSQPTCTAPCTPTAAAASRASLMPTSSSASGKSKCVWLSMTGTGSGSGAGGYPLRPVPSFPGDRKGTGVRGLSIHPP